MFKYANTILLLVHKSWTQYFIKWLKFVNKILSPWFRLGPDVSITQHRDEIVSTDHFTLVTSLTTLTLYRQLQKRAIQMSMCQMMMTNAMFNFPFIISIIPASPACGVYISLPMRYSRACVQYSDFSAQSSYVVAKATHTRLRCFQVEVIATKVHNIVDPYEIFISQMTMTHLLFTQMFPFLYHCPDVYRS